MSRILTWSAVVLLATQFVLAAGAPKKITVDGQLSGGAKILANSTISTNGQVSGSGKLYGATYNYPFKINKLTTGKGTITLSGNFTTADSNPVTITVAVPSGAQTFKYVVNSKTVTLTGTGTVAVQ